jgi:UDP-3-O-[3-hydroxymyristoyl] N-acetylglucosamine deacetylase
LAFSCETSVAEIFHAPLRRKQQTLKRSFSVSGIGVFTGEVTTLRLSPLEGNRGIIFKRTDLPSQPEIPAKLEYLKSTPRCTLLANNEASVQTVEHLLAALKAYEVDNVLIEISGPEVPIMDGSSLPFVRLIEESGVAPQRAVKQLLKLSNPFFWSQGDVHLIALPDEHYRLSYTLHYPHSPFIGSQFYSITLDPERFKTEIAPSRTFSLHQEIAPMIEKGFLKGGSLQNGVVIDEKGIMNPEGLRFRDEMVRHKILDLIGDLALIKSFVAHIIAVRSGHASNHAFALELSNHIQGENS